MTSAQAFEKLGDWVSQAFPDHPHAYWGRSGAALLFDAVRHEGRKRMVLPAFICGDLPAMALAAGLEVVLVDVSKDTMLMDLRQLEDCLAESTDAETILLIDHAFGYPFIDMPEVRRRHPRLLIIEDCVRALGSQIHGRAVGQTGDWTLLSMYKTTPGTSHGAILLSRSPYPVRTGRQPKTSWRQRLSTSPPLRMMYELAKRTRPDFGPTRREVELGAWEPEIGLPNQLCLNRFWRSLRRLDEDTERRRKRADMMRDALQNVEGVRLVQPLEGGDAAAYFLSFTVAPGFNRNRLLNDLHRRGLFLLRTWDSVPAFCRQFREYFRFGSQGSVYLADHVCHIPVDKFTSPRRRAHLIDSIRELMSAQRLSQAK